MRMVYDVSAAAVRVAWSFLGPPPKLSRPLPCCLRFRDPDASTTPQASSRTPWPRSSVARRCGTPPSASRSGGLIAKVLVPQRVALVPGVRDEVLGQVIFWDVDLDKAHQVPAPLVQFVQGLQATESNRIEHVEQESHIPSLVKLIALASTAHL